MTFIDNAPPDIKKPEQTSDNSLPTPSKDILKDIKDIPKDILRGEGDSYFEDVLKYVLAAVEALLRTWRQYGNVTDYTGNDFHQSKDDGTIHKLRFPVPWFEKEIAEFVLRETTVIIYLGKLTKELKHDLLLEAASFRFPDARRLHASETTFIFCRHKGRTRSSHNGEKSVYIIERSHNAGFLFYKFMIRGWETLVDGIVESLGNRMFRSTQKVAILDKEFLTELRKLRESEVDRLNELGRERAQRTW
jgi:hypothetical protein